MTLQRAYLTYGSIDDDFEQNIQEAMRLYMDIDRQIYINDGVPEFNKDPFLMPEHEINELYDILKEHYVSYNIIIERKKVIEKCRGCRINSYGG